MHFRSKMICEWQQEHQLFQLLETDLDEFETIRSIFGL
jgi:hypothetical protein